jgi:hypothetical protein
MLLEKDRPSELFPGGIYKYSPVYSVKFTGNKFGCDEQKRIFNYPLNLLIEK